MAKVIVDLSISLDGYIAGAKTASPTRSATVARRCSRGWAQDRSATASIGGCARPTPVGRSSTSGCPRVER